MDRMEFSVDVRKMLNGYAVNIIMKRKDHRFVFEDFDAMLDFLENVLMEVKPGSHGGGMTNEPAKLFSGSESEGRVESGEKEVGDVGSRKGKK